MIRCINISSVWIPNAARGIKTRGCEETITFEERRKIIHRRSIWQDNIPEPQEKPAFSDWGSKTHTPQVKSTFSEIVKKICQTFQETDKEQMKFTEGFLEGYRKGRWQGRKEAFFFIGSTLGLYSFIIHLRSGRKGS